MTRYADAGDLDTYGALPAATSALFTTAQKEAALDEASAFADGYIAAQVQGLPLTTWGADLRAAARRHDRVHERAGSHRVRRADPVAVTRTQTDQACGA